MTPQRDDPRFAEQRFTEQRPVRGRPPLTGTRVEWKIPPLEENQVPVAASIVETKLITCEGNIIPWVLPIDGGGHKIYVPSEMERRLTHLPNILEVVRCVPLNESELSAEELQSLAAWEQYRADA
ncbi:MAG: uncharacterized protein KVP18_003134 [Porospora cf. gigantea A]|uniref:uncharacterized protein n=1 Tax=Porospora cf. gigantea A TaxID=2853593 RepID=UPI003559C221|nr:MAG: hypothetical protein KVP18_003134 [Porospora cf. gigantea A]